MSLFLDRRPAWTFQPCLAMALFVALGVPASAQSSFVLLSDASDPGATSIFPNGAWATTPYEDESVLNDDWTFGTGSGVPAELYWSFSPGTAYGAASATISWDESAVGFGAVDGTAGVFAPPGGTVFASSLASPGAVQIDASRLSLSNGTAAAGEHAARLDLRVLQPGFSSITFPMARLRTYDGVGGQTDVAVSSTGAAVRAYLGDVAADTGGGTGDPTRGDGVLDFEDVVVFTQGYFAGTPIVNGSLADYKAKLDVGPTADGTPLTLPQSDLQIEFEDLIVFALSYAYSQTGVYPAARGPARPIALATGPARVEGNVLVVSITVEGASDLRAMGLEVDIAPDVVWVGAEGDISGFVTGSSRETVVLSAEQNGHARLDAAVLSGDPVFGDTPVAHIRLMPRGGESASAYVGRTDLVRIKQARLRTSANTPIPVVVGTATTSSETPDVDERLALSVVPNPASGPVTVAFDMSESGPARVSIFDALGRLVATPLDGNIGAGPHSLNWAATLSTGLYFVVVETATHRESQALSITR